jgi:hypothetical protein
MSRFYSDTSREDDKWSLPDCEVFWSDDLESDCGELLPPGWYYWWCLPGCMPDSDPFGPFDSAEDAIADCRDSVDC